MFCCYRGNHCLKVLSASCLQAKCEMDRYLSPQSQRDGASILDPFFADDPSGAPYTLNMNLYLPDGAYLRMGLCQQARPPQHQNHAGVAQVKSEAASPCFSPSSLQLHGSNAAPSSSSSSCTTPGHGAVAMETSAVNMTLTGLPDFSSVFSHAGALPSEAFVKQEVSSPFDQHADNRSAMFQLLDSTGLEHHHGNGMEGQRQPQQMHAPTPTVHAAFHDLPVASPGSQQEVAAKPAYRGLGPGAYTRPHTRPHFLQQQTPYLPPSPPSSEPGSPDRQKELLHAMSPPPSYAASIASKLAGGASALVPGPGAMALAHTTGHSPSGSQAAILPPAPTATSAPPQPAAPVRYNRRNNPDLEKRRIHHCDYPGQLNTAHTHTHTQTHCFWCCCFGITVKSNL